MSEAAIQNLKEHQLQLDEEGIMVGVSRQAVDETLAYADQLREQLAEAEARAARFRYFLSEANVALSEFDSNDDDFDSLMFEISEALKDPGPSLTYIKAMALQQWVDSTSRPGEQTHPMLQRGFARALLLAEAEVARLRADQGGGGG